MTTTPEAERAAFQEIAAKYDISIEPVSVLAIDKVDPAKPFKYAHSNHLFAIFREGVQAARAISQAAAEPVDRHGRMTDAMRDLITGMSVSVDVSTGEDDAENRLYGVVNEVMDCDGDKHGVTLLIYDTTPNFAAPDRAPSIDLPAPFDIQGNAVDPFSAGNIDQQEYAYRVHYGQGWNGCLEAITKSKEKS